MMKIAVSGKGGAGKTTIAGILARLLARDGKKILAIDADPSPSLASALGIPKEMRTTITPLSQMYELIEERTGVRPASGYGRVFKLNPKVDDLVEKYGIEVDGIKLLVLGTIQSAGQGCFCPENALLKNLIRHLVFKKEFLIIDMEAGVEHLGRGTAERVDLLIVVVEPGMRSVETAAKIKELASQLGVKKIAAILNKAKNENEVRFIKSELNKSGIPLLGILPYDNSIAEAELKGAPPGDDAPFVKELEKIKEKLLEKR